MSEITSDIDWTSNLETYFKQTGERCHALSILHKRAEARYSRLRNLTDLPIVVLGTVNGSISIGSNSLFGDSPIAPVCVGLVALLTAILSTVAAYFKWAQRAEGHRISSLHYAKLFRGLTIQMGLPRQERMTPADLLRNLKDNFDRLAEVSPMIPTEVIAEFKSKYDKPEYSSIAKPTECNGLEAITVYDATPPLSSFRNTVQNANPPTGPEFSGPSALALRGATDGIESPRITT